MPQDNLQKYKMQLLNGIENVIFAGAEDKEGIFNSDHQNLMFSPENATDYRSKNEIDNQKEVISLNKVNI